MIHRLPELPYPLNGLAPRISAETLEYHWGKHHRAYVENLNRGIAGTSYASRTLEELVRTSTGAVFNNSAQHFNHSLYWRSLSPEGGGEPRGPLAEAIRQRYGSSQGFREAFANQGGALFGSGWCWLVRKPDGSVEVVPTHDADCPLALGDVPLLVCDVWEHAYYIDYRNARGRYLEAFWDLVNWRAAEEAFEGTATRPQAGDTRQLEPAR